MLTTRMTVPMLLLAVGVFAAGVRGFQAVAVEAPAQEKDRPPQPPGNGEERTDLVRVATPRAGVVLVVGTEIKEGDTVPPDRIITVRTDGEVKKYRRLKPGDTVEAGQLLARVDDRLARADVGIAEARVAAAKADLVAAEKTATEAGHRYQTVLRLNQAVQNAEVRGALLTWQRYEAEVEGKKATVTGAELELKRARTILEMHQLRSPARGIVQRILKRPGEGVKALEPIVVIQVKEER